MIQLLRFSCFKISIVTCIVFTCTSLFSQQVSPSSLFIENKGQIINQDNLTNDDVLFLYSGKGIKIQLRKSGYSYELLDIQNIPSLSPSKKSADPRELLSTVIKSHRVDIDFLNMNSDMEIVKEGMSTDHMNYYVSMKNITNVHSFSKIIYKNVFPATDIEFILNEKSSELFKYNIILKKGADLNKVRFLLKGASAIRTQEGNISISTPVGIINESIPSSYYEASPGQEEKIDFVLNDNIISFKGKYDESRTFIIDPSTNRIWGTYYGGSTLDYCTATDVDALNNVYITGYTLSTANIATAGTYQSTLSGSYDIYLVKFDPNENRIWGTYFGGSSVEAAYGITITSTGKIYLCGDTFSTSGVATPGAHQTIYGGGIDDALLVKFDDNGQLLWSTYYGGNLHDIAIGVAEDSNGDVIMSGHTESAASIATSGSFNTSYSGGFDVFAVKFDSTGIRQWGTYYGEIDVEETFAIDCDASDNIYITGFTTSSNNIATAGGHQTSYSGQQDAFIAKFNPSGTSLLYGSYYGGPGNDQGTAIKTDALGNVFVAGNTGSFTSISTPGSFQPSIGSAEDGFIASFNSSGVRQWGTYFGGNDVDYIAGLALDQNENILFCGSTMSTDVISSPYAYQTSLSTINNYDSYFERFDLNGIREHGTYFGGSLNDHGRGIALNSAGNVLIAGETSSTDNIASPGAFSTTLAGGGDGFLAKFCVSPEPVVFPSGTTTICYGDTIWLTSQGGFASYLWSDGSGANPLITSDTAPVGTYYFTVEVNDGNGCNAVSDSTMIIVDLCSSVSEKENEPVLEIFPIPSSDLLFFDIKNISDNEDLTIEAYSSNGTLVLQEKSKGNTFKKDIKKLSPGIYILRVRVNENIFQKKFIKQ